MDSLTYVRNLLRSWWLVVIVLLAGGLGGYIVYARDTSVYASSVSMIVGNDQTTSDEATARTLAQLRAQTLAQIAATEPAVTAAVNAAGTRGGSLSVTASSAGAFVTVRVENTSADAAYRVAAQYPRTLPVSLARLAGNTGTRFSLHTVTAPVRAAAPFSPSRNRNILLGLAAGLVVGVALAVLREALNRSIRDSDQANAITHLPVLGVVPRLTPKTRLPAVDDPLGARAEAYRQVRTTLLSQTEKRPLVVAVTSATSGEGKTSVAANLAVVLARSGHAVVLIDADMRRPRVATLFDLDPDTGLSDVLRGTLDGHDALIDVHEQGLRVLPAGRAAANPSELLATPELGHLVRGLASSAEFVVLDTPPVLPVADARELVPAVDGFVFVVEMEGPSRDRVQRAIAALERVNATLLGIVPNRAGREVARDYRYRYEASRRDSPSRTSHRAGGRSARANRG